ncbi:MAG: cation:dicarboxylase symporter family transporter [Kordiimonadaceae bacterium]|jgi:uncharacterized protein|nr:cation:dicarboxylase symporter family transporter [Kordiimonadaceae bacterium]MBT6032335.1 cation:dicarboxylase symporter family transporter [Kordiimonadaceae bacterium]
MSLTIILNFLVFIGLLILISKSSGVNLKPSRKIFLGLLAGIIFGVILQNIYGVDSTELSNTLEWTNIIGDGYLSLLKMVTIPLILVTLISATSQIKNLSSIGKIGGLIIGILFITALMSSTISAIVSSAFSLTAEGLTMGAREVGTGAYFTGRLEDISNDNAASLLTSYIPSNIFSDFSGARPISILAVIVFCILFSIASQKAINEAPEFQKTFMQISDISQKVVMSLLAMIMRISPYGVMSLMTKLAATMQLTDIMGLGKFVIAAYLAIAIMFLIHYGLINLSGYDPKKYFKAAFPVLMVGGASSSASSCIPLTIEAQTNKLGVPKTIATISAAFGASNGQNACGNIFPTMLAIMIAPTVGINVDFEFIITLILVVTVSSFAIAGYGGGWPNAVLVAFPIMGLPIEMAGVLIAVDPLIDKARTALNISGAMVSGVITNQLLNASTTETTDQQSEKG